MLKFIKSFFGFRSEEPTPAPAAAPYKVEAPQPVVLAPVVVEETKAVPTQVKCGCGRSSTGFCVGLHKLSQEEWDAHPDNVKAKSKPAPKKSATAKKKPAAIKATAKPKAAKKPKAK